MRWVCGTQVSSFFAEDGKSGLTLPTVSKCPQTLIFSAFLTKIFSENNRKTIDFWLEIMLIWYGCPGYVHLVCPFLAIKARGKAAPGADDRGNDHTGEKEAALDDRNA